MGLVDGDDCRPWRDEGTWLMLYLASASPRRAQLLKKAGIRFKILKTNYHEKPFPGMRPSKLVQKHALGKAVAASKTVNKGTVLAADTVVYFRKKIIGKPKNVHNALKTLELLQEQWHVVYTGVAVLHVFGDRVVKRRVFFEKTAVFLKKMDRSQIRRYFRQVNPLDKAGSYAIQSRHHSIVQKWRGSFSNAVGLPMERLKFL